MHLINMKRQCFLVLDWHRRQKTKRQKTKRQKDKIEFKIGMSGQFHTLAMILCNCIHGAIA